MGIGGRGCMGWLGDRGVGRSCFGCQMPWWGRGDSFFSEAVHEAS
jgi:hypothetical protein